MYTVIQNTTTSTPSCQNVTYPASALQVDAAVVNGAFSQYGWVPQCTDIQVQATNGTPPYTLMVGPTLHPPLNITANSGPINWTVTLSHGIPFFISVTDANGNGWAQGPLHSGDGPDTSCLDINHSASSHSSTNVPVTVGATVGGVVLGLLAGALGISVIKRRRRRAHSKHSVDLMRDNQISPIRAQSGHESTTVGTTHHAGGIGLEYVVEPFGMPSPPSDPGAPLLPGGSTPTGSPADATSASGSDPADASITSGRRTNRQNVYVVHHDGGRAPVTVYTAEGAEVVELPPRYPAGSTSAPSEREDSDTTREKQQEEGGWFSTKSPWAASTYVTNGWWGGELLESTCCIFKSTSLIPLPLFIFLGTI